MSDGRSRNEFVVVNPTATPGLRQTRVGWWKVTARFVLHTKDGEIPCVRLRYGNGPSEYFSEDEFKRLFKEVKGP